MSKNIAEIETQIKNSKVELRNIVDLLPYARNSRTHSDAQINQIAGSIKEFGFTNPVLVKENGELIAGHGRVVAALRLKLTQVPCIVLKHLTDIQAKAYVIADNQLALNAGWDESMLSLEVKELKGFDFDLGLLGFDAATLQGYLGAEEEKVENSDDDEMPDDQKRNIHNVKRGQIWQLGQHRLMCGDTTSEDDIAKLMDGKKVDMVFTDPPYGMFLDTNYDAMFANDEKHAKKGKRFDKVKGDNEDFNPKFITNIFKCFGYAKEIFLWGADYYSDLIEKRIDGSWVVWDKRCNENMDKVSGNTFELCWSKQKHKRLIARIMWSGHHGMQKDDTKTRVHPTQKPVELIKWFFEHWGKDIKVVADVFGGSGSTLAACEKTGRQCYTLEYDEHYCSVIIERWQRMTGGVAELVSE